MSRSSDIRASSFPARGPSTGARGGPRVRGFIARGPHGGSWGGWHSRGAPAGRVIGGPSRGVSTGLRRPHGSGRGKGPSLCLVCGAGEGRYKFKCCHRPFCSTACYKTHVAAPCDGPPEQSRPQQQQAAPKPTVSDASAESVSGELHAAPDDVETEDGALLMAEPEAPRQIEAGFHAREQTQQGMPNNINAQGPPVESSSSSGEGESDEASSDDSDDSHPRKRVKWIVTPRHRAHGESKFDSLSAREQEEIKALAATPEMQSASLRDSIRALVAAGSRGPGCGAAALKSLMRRPEFAAFVASLLDVLVHDCENNQKPVMHIDDCDQRATQRCVGEPGSRLN
ncbi:hypothetical protein ACSSS7_000965 [Eimeria intestinalis]